MRLLIVTQKVDQNDSVLGFFHRWIEEFAKHCEQITVIALGAGEYHLPDNVRVFSLGKERGVSRLKYVINFYFLIWRERKNYNAVFVHMNPIYVVLGGLFWKMWGKKISLWYTHKQVDLKLRIAEKLSHIIFTASPESFRIESPKRNFMGQAVDIEKFKRPADRIYTDKPFKIVSVGRLTPIKNIDTLIRATKILKDRGNDICVKLIGAAVTEGDRRYEKMLHELVNTLSVQNEVIFVGNIPNNEVAQYYWDSHLSLNLCPTGGMDKVILESMAAGTPAVVSNEAFRGYFGEYANELIFKLCDEVDCANKIEAYIKNKNKEALKIFLLKRVEEKSTLSSLIKQIVRILGEVKNKIIYI